MVLLKQLVIQRADCVQFPQVFMGLLRTVAACSIVV